MQSVHVQIDFYNPGSCPFEIEEFAGDSCVKDLVGIFVLQFM